MTLYATILGAASRRKKIKDVNDLCFYIESIDRNRISPQNKKPRSVNRGLRLVFSNGATGRNRTSDTRIFSPLLYRLSYRGALYIITHSVWLVNPFFSSEFNFSAMTSSGTIMKNGGADGTRTRGLQRDRLAC